MISPGQRVQFDFWDCKVEVVMFEEYEKLALICSDFFRVGCPV